MIVYVESNFVLTLAYLQEQYPRCEELLQLAEQDKVKLVIPAFSIGEPIESFVRRTKDRQALLERFGREIYELGRSEPYAGLPDASLEATRVLATSQDEEKARLDSTILRTLRSARTIPITPEVYAEAVYLESEVFDTLQDAIVCASVLSDLRTQTAGDKCFITRNPKDFLQTTGHFEALGCRLLFNFDDGLGYIGSRLGL